MKKNIKQIINILAAAACLSPLTAVAYEPLAAKIKVSSGTVYDYVSIGEKAKATDGYDNAFDSMSPGDNLNAIYINSYLSHPEWGQLKSTFKGDIRSIAEKQEWTITIASTLPAGTDLTVALKEGRNLLPAGLKLIAQNNSSNVSADLVTGALHIPAPGGTATTLITVTAIQPSPPAPVVVPTPVPAADPVSSPITDPAPAPQQVVKPTGDYNGDGKVNIDDIKQLRTFVRKNQANIPEGYLTRADMNSDGKLTIEDVKIIENNLIKKQKKGRR